MNRESDGNNLMNKPELIGDATKCLWCGRKLPTEPRPVQIESGGKQYNAAVCSEAHAHAVTRTYAYIRKVFPLFPVGLATGLILMVVSNFISRTEECFFVGLILMGVTMQICPCATPQTVELLGFKRSIALVRIISAAAFILVPLGLLIARLMR